MSLELTFEIEMTSDYHVGAGYGRGTEIDSALLQDADGVPVLRGTVLNGLLRDALWHLLQQAPMRQWRSCQESGLDKNETDERYCGQYNVGDAESCPICRVFGTPRTMKRWRVGSARPVKQERLATTKYKAQETATQRVMRVRVNPRTRRAAPHKLFSEEQGGQLTFTFTTTCPAEGKVALDEAALLVAAARFVRQLGRSRRRGQGECLFSLVEVKGVDLGEDPQETLLDRFEKHWLKGKPEALAQAEYRSLEKGRKESEERERVRLRVLIRLDEPLIIAKRASAGNQFHTQLAIPGKTLWGALAARAAERFDLEDPVTYDAFIDLFLRESVRFPTLYPLLRTKGGNFQLAASVPCDGFACKVYREHPIQWGIQGEDQTKTCRKCQEQGQESAVKAVRGKFLPLREHNLRPFEPEKRSEMHIRVDPESGRVKEGQIFEYEALEAGQYFAGEMTCIDEDAWELLKTLTDLEEETSVSLRLGKATRRGYGKVTLWLQQPDEDNEPSIWIQQPLGERIEESKDSLTLTLLTDAVVTDAWGRFITGFDETCQCGKDESECQCKCEWLSDTLGFDVQVVKGCAFAATHLVDGFNTKLRLPRWRDVALTAGSTVQLKILDAPKDGLLDALAQIEQEGIGLRKNEGCGQVAFNHPIHTNCAGLTDTQIEIPSEVDLAMRGDTDEGAKAKFREDWAEYLEDQQWDQCKAIRFLGLARWLDAHRHEPIDVLLGKMDALGEPDELLIERIGGVEEHGDREIANPLADEKCFGLIKKMVNRLQEKNATHRPLGVRILADRLAEAASERERER
ncbi:MAG: RAMP superfamily CRISPR-associated protein [Chloroflexota bacterium]|nr:RAMP superfamily CRISPR-associated protein [Chloroflexota bacterium]